MTVRGETRHRRRGRIAAIVLAAVLALSMGIWAWVAGGHLEALRECAAVRAAIAPSAGSSDQPGASCIDRVAARLQAIVRRHPVSADSFAALARFHGRLGRPEDASRCWKRCKELEPSSAGMANEALGGLSLAEGRFEEAAALFREAFEADLSSHTVPIQLAEALLGSGRPVDARLVLDEVIRMRADSLAAHSLRGQASLQLKDYERAVEDFSRAVEIAPDYAAAQHGLATAASRLGDGQTAAAAREAFERLHEAKESRHRRSLATHDDDRETRARCAVILSDVARVHFAHGEADEGLARLDEALQFDGEEPSCLLLLARVQEARGMNSEAIEAYRRGAAVGRDDGPHMLAVAAGLQRLRAYDDSLEAYRTLVDRQPLWAAAYAAFAQMLLEWGRDPEEAVRLSRRAAELQPSAALWGLVSEACERVGDERGAVESAGRAVALAPDDVAWKRRFERLSVGSK